jgi:hypothetical protein
MQDDIRPRSAAHPLISTAQSFSAPVTSVEPSSPLSTSAEFVNEAKLAEEFGPPPDTAKAQRQPEPIHEKIRKLLSPHTVSHHHRRPLILVGIGLGIALIAGSASFAILHYYRPTAAHYAIPIYHKPKPVVPVTVPSTLTGLLVDPSVNDRPVTAVMIENSIDARPQSGLDQAGVVFEAIAEGGVTRFMALFQDSTPDYIGPVRSARPYYLQWLLGFDAAYAHVGGSPDGLADISAWHVKDLNEFYNDTSYQRISTRYAPHNVYTSIANLNALEARKGFSKSNYTGFTRKAEAPSKIPTTISINIKFSGFYYDSHYDYDTTTNTYKRSESGTPHMELHKDGSQTQIAPKVIVAMIVPEHNGALDSSGAYYADYAAVGSGQIVVFQDGATQTGTWTKNSNTNQISFTDITGKPLAFNVGQTWVAATPLAGNITYK